MGGQLSLSREIQLISHGGEVGVVNDPLGIGSIGIFQVVIYSALELAIVAGIRICGRR
jgi:hypothetical protein